MCVGWSVTRYLSTSLAVFLLCLAMGCQFQKRQTAAGMRPPTTAPEQASVEKVQQNLSMADTLRDVSPGEYTLGPEDKLQITVFRRDEMDLQVAVTQTGKISYYLVGDVDTMGLTQFELRDKLSKLLADYIKDPAVVVKIIEHRSHKVYVLGQVEKPGLIRMQGDITLIEAISRSGGLKKDAYLGGAYVVRDGKILLLNFVELVENGNMAENIPLLAGDIVYIPSTKDQKVYVLGEVNKQSAIGLRDGMTLLGAVAEAGGFTKDASKGSILVMRGNLSTPEILKIDLEEMTPKANVPLQRGDIVYVASTSFANLERAAIRLNNILQPFYNLTRTVVWGDAAVGVMEGKDSRFIVTTEE
jgi:polysaccharide export outer membrane protein